MTNPNRSYKPGFRNKEFHGKHSNKRWAWVQTMVGQFVIWADYFEVDGVETDEVRDIKLLHPIQGRKMPVSWNLTACTEEELVAMKDLFDTAFEFALPIARQRDKEAHDAFVNENDDSHSRIYRQVPQLVYRKRPEREHGEGVHDGPSDAAPASQPGGDLDAGVRPPEPGVAERDAEGSGSEDDGTPTD